MPKDETDARAPSRFDAMFESQLNDMHGIQAHGPNSRGCGTAWSIDPSWGCGSYWYLPIDDMAAIAVFDLTFYEKVDFGINVPNLFCFGSYGKSMVPYFSQYLDVEEGSGRSTLLGYAWRSGMCQETVKPDERLVVASMSLLTDGATHAARQVGTDPVSLTTAIASLDGSHRIPALTRLFDEVKTARLSARVAPAYYRSKFIEACALLADWQERRKTGGETCVHEVDLTSLNLACAFARENLGEQIGLDDLCRAACTSPSKLAAIFKTVEGTTPMGWVRDRRMEYACELLSDTGDSLADIASAVGFGRQSSFSEAFKQRFGVTPLHYRSQNRCA